MAKSPKDTKGPIVKSGPTRGQNRSRNKDGTWHKKRSDTGKSRDKRGSGKKGCFITSAVCEYKGLPDSCHQLAVLRHFRDNTLLRNATGREMVDRYYLVAPSLAPLVNDPHVAEKVWQEINETVREIESENFDDAVIRYKNIVKWLSEIVFD